MMAPDLADVGPQIVGRYLVGKPNAVTDVRWVNDDVLVSVSMLEWRVSATSFRFAPASPAYHAVEVVLTFLSDPPLPPRGFAIVDDELFCFDIDDELRGFWGRVSGRLTQGEVAEIVGRYQGTNPTTRVIFSKQELHELAPRLRGAERLYFTPPEHLRRPLGREQEVKFCTFFVSSDADRVEKGSVEQWVVRVSSQCQLEWRGEVALKSIPLDR